MPTMPAPTGFTVPKYSGARKSESAPYVCINFPSTVLNRRSQKISNTWYFLKCRNINCTGKE
jgi:hypothetical protein